MKLDPLDPLEDVSKSEAEYLERRDAELLAGLTAEAGFSDARGPGKKSSATDPPWNEQCEKIAQIAGRLEEAVRSLEACDEAFDQWIAHCDGFKPCDRPEDFIGRLIVAALQPELEAWIKANPHWGHSNALAAWLVQQPAANRMLRCVANWALCAVPPDENKRRQQAFFAETYAVICDLVGDWRKLS